MNMSWITALSGMVGSVVGVSTSVAVAWMKQKTLDERELLREEIRKRETLYGEFISECARLIVDAYQHTPALWIARSAGLGRAAADAHRGPVLCREPLRARAPRAGALGRSRSPEAVWRGLSRRVPGAA